MARFRITDNQSGKTLVISGDSAPTEQEAEDLFNQSGIRQQSSGQMTPEQALAKQFPLNQSIPQGQPPSGLLPQLSNFLMPNVVKYAQSNLQQIGQGNLTPTRPQINADSGVDLLMSILGPGAQQVAGFTGLGSEAERQKNMGARELAQTFQLVRSVAGATGGLINKTGETIRNIAETKSINPFTVTGHAREKAIEAAGKLDTSSIIEAGEKYVKNNELAKEVWEIFKPSTGANLSAKDLIYKMSKVWDVAYDKSWDVRNQAAAKLFNELYQAGKNVIRTQAPNISSQNAIFKLLYDAPKNVQRATWLALKTTAIGKMLGL